MNTSNCCGAKVYDNYDICTDCWEHCGVEETIEETNDRKYTNPNINAIYDAFQDFLTAEYKFNAYLKGKK
jgi:hypothetical protein